MNKPGGQPHARKSFGRGWKILLWAALWLLPAWWIRGEDEPVKAAGEYEIKAALIYNFLKFVDWNADTPDAPSAPLVIGVLGQDPFQGALESMTRRTVGGRPLVVRDGARPEDLPDCRVLFISNSERDRLPEILLAWSGRRVLTISDLEGFARHGGMIEFYLESGRTRFKINIENVQAAGLRLSAQLLKSAQVVRNYRSEN